MPVRRFILELLTFALLQVLLLSAFLGYYYDPEYAFPQYRAHTLKHDRLATAESPRMICVGGSNLLFGIESEYISQHTKYEPINMGLVGAVGLAFLIDEVEDAARPGDLIVLSIEYGRLCVPFDAANMQIISRVLQQRPASASHLTWSQWRMMSDTAALDQLGFVFRKAWWYSIHGTPRHAPLDQTHNQYGDLIIYRPGSTHAKRAGRQQTIPRRPKWAEVQANIIHLNRFARRCAQRGVEVVFSYPPVPASQYQDRTQQTAEFDALLRKQLEFPLIDRPQDMVFDDAMFVVPSYHLYGEGIRARTRRLVDSLNDFQQSLDDH